MLIDGLNVELSNIGTLQRRPGTSVFSTANLGSSPITFYSFHPPSNAINPITIIADTATNVYTLSPTAKTSILTKANGSGQSYFQGVGTTLYIGDGADLQAWNGTGTTRNWGIAMSNVSSSVGPNGCGTGSDVNVPGTIWANPGNITANDGSFATITLTPPNPGTFTAGPNAPSNAITTGAGAIWLNPANIESLDGSAASTTVPGFNDSQFLQGSAYNFGIPNNATINGIIVSIFYIGVGAISLAYGSIADLWGTSWVPADINNSGFGVQLQVQGNGVGGATDTVVQLLKAGVAVGNNNAFGTNVTALVDFISITINYTVPVGNTSFTDLLEGTNFGFALSSANTISGILVEIKGVGNSQPVGTSLTVSILKNGSQSGVAKTGIQLLGSNNFISLGGSSDLWGTTFSPGDINSASFGVSIQGLNSGSSNGIWSVDFVRITIFGTGGPVIAVSGAAGSFSATVGYAYVFAYGNSNSAHVSNPTPPSASTGVFTNKLNVSVTLTASTDPQVNQIRVFRTKDGGSTFFELPTSPYPNTSTNITDASPDSSLNLFNFFLSSPTFTNNPPPAGLINLTYHLNRVWGSVGNILYYSGGPDTNLGNGAEAFPPSNVFVLPSAIKKLVPISNSLLVFTTDDVWAIVGTTTATFYDMMYQEGIGILSWNALDVQGSNMFMYTSDKQFIAANSSGAQEIGFAIGDTLQATFNPANVYVASLIAGTTDKAVFIADGTSNWYRCNWNQPPEGGPAWSPKAFIVGGATAVVSVETSPGVHNLLIGQSDGTVLMRDLTVFADNGVSYSAFASIGSIVLAQPGQIAEVSSINVELQKVGSIPNIGVLLEEISGTFENLVNSVDSPARLKPSSTVYSKRFDLSQGNNPQLCRHLQVKISWASEAFKNELLTLSIFGKLRYEE
jgi:hypothetical protein